MSQKEPFKGLRYQGRYRSDEEPQSTERTSATVFIINGLLAICLVLIVAVFSMTMG